MSDFYSPFRALPQAFIDLGALVPITLTRDSGTFNPATMNKTNSTSIIAGHGVLSVRKTRADDGSIKTTMVAKLTVEPLIGDKLNIGSKIYTIDETTTVAPDGNSIMFEATVS